MTEPRRTANFILVLFLALCAASCDKIDPPDELKLHGGEPDPVLYTGVIKPEFYVVTTGPFPFGCKDMSALVIVENGSGERRTFPVPATMKLDWGDFIKAYKLCYRAHEKKRRRTAGGSPERVHLRRDPQVPELPGVAVQLLSRLT